MIMLRQMMEGLSKKKEDDSKNFNEKFKENVKNVEKQIKVLNSKLNNFWNVGEECREVRTEEVIENKFQRFRVELQNDMETKNVIFENRFEKLENNIEFQDQRLNKVKGDFKIQLQENR